MKTSLFTNQTTIRSSAQRVQGVLSEPQNLLQWDSEITELQPLEANQFVIYRQNAAINQQETIKIITSEKLIRYVSTNGTIEYQVDWLIEPISEHTTNLSQTLFLTEKNLFLPLAELLRPVTKKAFYENLKTLKLVCEQQIGTKIF
ncbi:SRPBCC family protein [Bombilactobacillus folatiphilus]|uniref:SRPBCC family protein n=1 Tax=Bombilactobacillus folatiphilus TaxID=2923362 RepID=A0ABY4P952_9LACO|nr:SRPBCC family protein [Bombilactobacillus folatiphilus]UQS82258.1 SRPBCC family protein [Bombilactobacillus folatiphilus]